MATVLASPWEGFLIAFLLVFAIYFLYRSTSRFSQSLETQDNPYNTILVVSGARALIIAISFILFALGLFFDSNWPIWLGLGFLAEELIETGIAIYSAFSYKRDVAKDLE